jgi:hypothetical protein
MADTKVSAETLVSEVKANYKIYIVTDTGAAPDSNAARMSQVKDYLEITSPPQGRLTVASGSPVVTSSDSGNTTMYYTPYVGRQVPLYDGTRFVMTDMGGELSQLLSDTGDSPAAAAAASNYDMYVWLKNGSPVVSRARAWESATVRDTGNAITRVEGIYLNNTAFTNGPSAQRGTYVGTIRTDPSSAEVTFRYGAISIPANRHGFFGVWNMYNRVLVDTQVGDTSGTWAYSTGTFRNANDVAETRVSYIVGVAEDGIHANYVDSLSGNASIGVGLDSSTAVAGSFGYGSASTNIIQTCGGFDGVSTLGFHYFQAIESAWGATTFYGKASFSQNMLSFRFRM